MIKYKGCCHHIHKNITAAPKTINALVKITRTEALFCKIMKKDKYKNMNLLNKYCR